MATAKYFYTPIIKGKMWDLKALGKISANSRTSIKPLIEAMPVPDGTTVDEHLHKFTDYVRKYFPIGPIFVDFYGMLPSDTTDDGTSAVVAGFRLLKGKGRIATPAYGLQRDDSIWQELREIAASFDQGFCFRIDIDDLDDAAEDSWSEILERSAQLAISSDRIDLLIDLRDVRDRDVVAIKNLILDFLAFKPQGQNYRSISVVGSSALKTVSTIPKDGESDVQRRELAIWTQLQVDLGDALEIGYGDYGVIHPDFSDSGPNNNANAKIRYTIGSNIRYFRGHCLFDPPGFKQFHGLANRVRNSDVYRGRMFSFGDQYLDDCADLNVGSGHLGTWVQVDMNHHIEYTAPQIQRLRIALQSVTSTDEAYSLLDDS